MSALLVLSACALATWLLRVSFLNLLPADLLPAGLRRALNNVGPAALGALVVTGLVGHGGLPALLVPSAQHVALLVAALVAWRIRNLAAPMAAALAVMIASGWLA
jgi:branched-subunit amino acid transport protein